MNQHFINLLKQMQGEGALDEAAELLKRRYYEEWLLTADETGRKNLFLKTQLIDEMLIEFSTIIDSNPEIGR